MPAKPAARRVTTASVQTAVGRKVKDQWRHKVADWQRAAYGYEERIGELHYVMDYMADKARRLRLYPAVVEVPGEPPVPVEEAADLPAGYAEAALAEVGRLDNSDGGSSQLLADWLVHREIAGEGWLIGYGLPDLTEDQRDEGLTEWWEVRSVEEVGSVEGRFGVKESGSKAVRLLDPDESTWLRIFQRSRRSRTAADSPMHAVLGLCEELLLLELMVKATISSRAAGPLLFIPQDWSFGPADVTADEQDGEATDDPLTESLMTHWLTPVQEPGSASAVAPAVIRYPGSENAQSQAFFLSHERKVSETEAAQRKETIQRLATAMNQPVEVLTGLASLNHWQAWAVGEQAIEALESRIPLFLDGVGTGQLRPALREQFPGADVIGRTVLWYDPTELVTRPNRNVDAMEGHDRLALSDATLRGALGFAEEDAPDDEELVRRIAIKKGIFDAPLTEGMLEEGGIDVDPQLRPQQGTGGGPGQEPAAPVEEDGPPASDVTASASPRVHDLGARLAAIDTALRTRLEVAAEAALDRAMEKAGARLRNRSKLAAEAARNAPNEMVLSLAGRGIMEASGLTEDELLQGAFAALAGRFGLWTLAAQRQAADELEAAGLLDEVQRETLERDQDEDRESAWVWMLAALLVIARHRLYSPGVEDGPGEVDLSARIPYGLIRIAVALAGGSAGLTIDAAKLTGAAEGGLRPLGGIGTGERVRGVMSQAGATVTGNRWVYGPAHRERPFLPHRELDGQTFAAWDSPTLYNAESAWLPVTSYYPGDHAHDLCDWVPVIALPAAEPLAAAAAGLP